MAKADGSFRPLTLFTVQDRLVQRAVLNVLEPFVESHLLPCNFGYRSGRGVKDAIEAVMRYRQQGLAWVLDADIQHFFDSIDHQILRKQLRSLLRDQRLLDLLESWWSAHDGSSVRPTPDGKGIPQGAVLSPLLANVYLLPFDQEVLKRGHALIRYVDDFLVLARDEKAATRARRDVERALKKLRLNLHPEKTSIHPFDQPFTFLGVSLPRPSSGRVPQRVTASGSRCVAARRK